MPRFDETRPFRPWRRGCQTQIDFSHENAQSFFHLIKTGCDNGQRQGCLMTSVKKLSLKNKPTQPDAKNGVIAREVLNLIHAKMDAFTKSERFLAEYIINFPEKIGYISIAKLAEASGVSVATIVRFCNKLGYNGYAELGRQVQKSIQFELSTLMRFGIGREYAKNQDADQETTFQRIIQTEMESMERMSNSVNRNNLETCINWMSTAENIVIIGNMGSAALASYFGYAASKVIRTVITLNQTGVESPNLSKAISHNSLVFVIAFPRYPESTLMVARLCKEKGCKIVAITNDNQSPAVPLSNMAFIIPISMASIVDSYSAPLTFIHALIAEYSIRYPEQTNEQLNSFEQYTKTMNIWHKPKG